MQSETRHATTAGSTKRDKLIVRNSQIHVFEIVYVDSTKLDFDGFIRQSVFTYGFICRCQIELRPDLNSSL